MKKCHICKTEIQAIGLKCVQCSANMGKEILFHPACFDDEDHSPLPPHEKIDVNLCEETLNNDYTNIITFERTHLNVDVLPKIFADDEPFIRTDFFKRLSYAHETNGKKFLETIPFIIDYLRMNTPLEHLFNRLNLHLCETDAMILLFKYTNFEVRLSLVDQLCLFRRPIPIYFGAPNSALAVTSFEHYLLKQEMLYAFLKHYHQPIPFMISFGTRDCKEKTPFLNSFLQTNFDYKGGNISPSVYHNHLVQMTLNHELTIESLNNKVDEKTTFRCHVFDFHGYHEWQQLPAFFVQHMDIILIHVNVFDFTSNSFDQMNWPSVTISQKALYLVCIHGNYQNENIFQQICERIRSKFPPISSMRLNIFSANSIKQQYFHKLGLIRLLSQASVTSNRLWLGIQSDCTWEPCFPRLTSNDLFTQSEQILKRFYDTFCTISKNTLLPNLLPLSRLKELNENQYKSDAETHELTQLNRELNDSRFQQAHSILRSLIDYATVNNMVLFFENTILLWNTAFYAQTNESDSNISTVRHLAMNPDVFIHEMQERSSGYTNWNGVRTLYYDSDFFRHALIQIYQTAFKKGEHIEIINGSSSRIYHDIFSETFSAGSKDDIKDHYVIGIIGEKSSGKSFLMNKAFGTKVAEFEMKSTTGILVTHTRITHHPRVKDLIILDTEGLLDGSKKQGRGGAEVFDRKIVLEVMARSHIVLINIPCNVSQPIQQVLEIVLYGMNKLTITSKPKLFFIFRNQVLTNSSEENQNKHVSDILKDLHKICEKSNFLMDNVIDTKKVFTYAFGSPFANVRIGEKKLNTYDCDFCERALALRRQIIEELAPTSPFPSFAEWLKDTLDLWEQIDYNSNLFDHQSVLQLTLEKELQTFCIEQLSKAEKEIKKDAPKLMSNSERNNSHEILSQYDENVREKRDNMEQNILRNMEKQISNLMRQHQLERFPTILRDNAHYQIQSTLTRYANAQCSQVQRQLQHDEIQTKLNSMPKQLLDDLKKLGSICENANDFERSYLTASTGLRQKLNDMLETKYMEDMKEQWKQLLEQFISISQIDTVGIKLFHQYMADEELKKTIKEAISRKLGQQRNFSVC
jgi:hypothetical protein